ncbi:hypothetical protein [Campylobacter lanienae]|uniref:hypothetical protein n=1 Tax=Campylobacter lanienae TaxID=75658 RepID=UPI0024328786|nr:hypothetical protein [Campylobacter lanienae]MDD7513785.1 hypothetical protein [Campylobacter lanienae]MDY5518724.1 hypothetical protein [Campylobacter lanienae]
MLLAPFDGVVGDNRQNVGSFAERDSELVRISKLDPIYVRFGMSDVRKLKIDNSVADGLWKRLNPTISMIIDDIKYTGKLIFIDSVVNTDTVSSITRFFNPFFQKLFSQNYLMLLCR